MTRDYRQGWLAALLVTSVAWPAAAQDAAAAGATAGEHAPAAEESTAEDEQARGLFEAGRTAYSAARFADALRYFREAHGLSGRPELLFNIGSAAERLRRDREALEAYEAYVEQLPGAANRAFAEERISFLRAQVEAEATVPSPAEAASASTPSPEGAEFPLEDPPESREGPRRKAWVWAVVGAVVLAGAAVGVGIAVSGGGGVREPIPGDVGPGGIVVALGSP